MRILYERVKMALRYFSKFNVSNHAASASYFIVLSIFPLFALVLTLLRFLPLTFQDLLSVMDNVLPSALMPVLEYVLEDLYTSNAAAIISVSGIVAVWSASRGVFGILTGLNSILDAREHRSYIRRRFTAIVYTLLMIAALLITLILQVFGKRLLLLLESWGFVTTNIASLLVDLRYVFTIGFLSLFFMLIFAVFPARRMHLRDVVPGAILTSAGWVIFSGLFSIYVNYGGGSKFYGSMTTVILCMLWMYICMCILFYGGVICALSAAGKFNWKTAKNFFSLPKNK